MMKYTALLLLVISFVSCKKDNSTPAPPVVATPGIFSLVDGSGNCYTPVVQGTYVAGTDLNNSNQVSLQVNVTKTGTYSISTNILNGYRFSGTGTFSTLGLQTITLRGFGTPVVGSNDQHTIITGTSCMIMVTVTTPAPVIVFDNDHMYFGNPSKAAALTDSIQNYLMRKNYYALSYSRDRGIPNWVSWHLFANDLGSVSRQDDFREDNTLPFGWYRVQDISYSATGFDRGHNVASADRTNSVDANSATFLMTNIIPQAPYHNQIVWSIMEDSLRRLVNLGNELYIIMGNYGEGGTGNNGFTTAIDAGRVTVPSNIWKIAVVIPNGDSDSSRVNENTRVIAVDVPNTNTLFSSWKNYRTSVDAIEAATGYDILSRLSPFLQSVLEARVDNL